MNTLEAVKQMKEGKKVRLESFHEGVYMFIKDGVIMEKGMYETQPAHLFVVMYIEATDWEVVEEKKKTLSNKIMYTTKIPMGLSSEPYEGGGSLAGKSIEVLRVESVKEAISEITEFAFEIKKDSDIRVRDKIRSIVGERLLP